MPLNPGDILFVGWDADNEDIAFVTTVDLPAGEVIYFTDDEWDGTAFNGGEQYMEWTVPAGGVTAGTIVTIDMDPGARTATIDAGGGFDYMRGGYQIAVSNEMFWAFQGTRDGNIAIPENFIAVIANEADGNFNQTPNLAGTGLTEENGAFIVDGDEDYMEWIADAAVGDPVQREDLIASVLDQDNWVTADGVGNNNPNGDGFDVQSLNVVCFASGVGLATPDGERPVEALEAGDLVATVDNGFQPIRWAGRRRFGALTLARDPRLRPVVIRKGALGPGAPSRDLVLSRQHRVMLRSKIAKRMFGAGEVLTPVCKLTDAAGVEPLTNQPGVTYHHFLLDRHEVLIANGAPAESLWLGASSRGALGADALEEIALVFPDGAPAARDPSHADAAGQSPARPLIDQGARIRRLAQRHAKNDRALLDAALPIVVP